MKKVVVIGPECTGKSTLTQALAQHFNCPYRPEYAREYIAQLSAPYTPKDILHIAKKQIEIEDAIPKIVPIFSWTPTSSYARYGVNLNTVTATWILEQIQERHYDYYLLCDIDLLGKTMVCENIPIIDKTLLSMKRN